ncbi:GNAT family N-acetyltransferase [Neptunomonas japonica]|uniref:GNAT family N-acetyltransferase n=1 Tax=Neptunomonas japonica TaxID=417574 RepID=UPI00041C64A8|nr:GNAT family N-acetyltransferase [Neptunomonas japonica]
MQSSISVAPLNVEDRDQWETLYKNYALFYEVPMDQPILDTVWSWIFDENKQFFALIAKDDQGHALGLMHFREMPSPLRGKSVGFLDDLYVDSSVRGEGVVEQLFSGLSASAKEHSWPHVRWITAENNYRARAVYDKLASKTYWQTYQLICD